MNFEFTVGKELIFTQHALENTPLYNLTGAAQWHDKKASRHTKSRGSHFESAQIFLESLNVPLTKVILAVAAITENGRFILLY